ncbi:hypothetical protein BURC_02736 [Burkholderiaceae bacterium]|nr:hypothetical protein BURC_02736 [Burkholderiaceae bacterium]
MSSKAVLEVLDRDGHVRHYLPVHAWPVRAGRALDNDLILDDSYIAAHHFLIDADDTGVFVQAGDTINGLRANGRHLAAGQRAPVGAQPVRLDVGDSHLRLRLAEHAVPAEQPMRTPHSLWHAAWPTLAAGALVFAVLLFTTWLDTDPDELTRALGSMLVTVLVAGAAWCAGWSLVSKIFTRRSHFLWHLRVLLIGVLAIDLASALSQLLAFSLSWPLLSDFSFVPVYAIGAAMLYFHALGVEPRRPARLRAAALGVLIGGTALSLWFNHQNRDQFGDELYMNHLFPPALRLAGTTDTASFVQGLAPLQASLDQKAKKRDAGDDGEAALDED